MFKTLNTKSIFDKLIICVVVVCLGLASIGITYKLICGSHGDWLVFDRLTGQRWEFEDAYISETRSDCIKIKDKDGNKIYFANNIVYGRIKDL